MSISTSKKIKDMAFTQNMMMMPYLGKVLHGPKTEKFQNNDVTEISFNKGILKATYILMSFPLFIHFSVRMK